MIPADFIAEWREKVPWVLSAQVEQDLVISRALVELLAPGIEWDLDAAAEWLAKEVVPRLEGDPWKGSGLDSAQA